MTTQVLNNDGYIYGLGLLSSAQFTTLLASYRESAGLSVCIKILNASRTF